MDGQFGDYLIATTRLQHMMFQIPRIFHEALYWLAKKVIAYKYIIEGSLEGKLPTIWTDEKQSREEAERRERLEERRVEEKD